MWELWLLCAHQWRTGGFGLIGLDLPAVLMVAERLGMPVEENLIRKLSALERCELERQASKAKSTEGAADGS